jgi:hypothetical protein
MGTKRGGKAVLIQGKKKYAFPREVSGKTRWFVDKDTDVTDLIALKNDSNAVLVLAKRGRPPKGDQERGEIPLAPVVAPSLEALTQALQRMDSQIQSARDVLKDVEVHLRAIKQQLNGADHLRELAIAEERERAKKREPKGHEKMTNRDGRMQTGGIR